LNVEIPHGKAASENAAFNYWKSVTTIIDWIISEQIALIFVETTNMLNHCIFKPFSL
jgi:hypothetical protein